MSYVTITTDVDVCIDDVLAELTNQDLLAEVKARKIEGHEALLDPDIGLPGSLGLALVYLNQNNPAEAMIHLERALPPDFSGLLTRHFGK